MSTVGGRSEHASDSVSDVERLPQVHDERSTTRGFRHEKRQATTVAFQGDDSRRGARANPGRKSNLPHLPSTFVGRRREISEVTALLGQSRLVTLFGPPGVGKTRLAIRVAARVGNRFPGGVWLAELSSLTDSAGLPGVVGAVLPPFGDLAAPQSAADLARRIGDEEMLLVLDTCEHLVEACAGCAEVLLESCPGLGILATSREPLGIAGEHVMRVGPLSRPEADPADVSSVPASEAGELFVRRAAATSSGFTLSEATAPAVATICRRLDGLALPIELAAARVASLSVDQILERIGDPMTLLNTGRRTAEPRHQSVAAAFEWSHDLLTPSQAVLLRRLAVFSGWTIEAAETVCAGGEVLRDDIVDLLAALVNKSLVNADATSPRVRYHLLDTIRSWAAAKLDAAPEGPDIRRRHAMWCCDLAETTGEQLRAIGQPESLQQLEDEHGNLRTALEWAHTSDDPEIALRLATALAPFWRARNEARQGVVWLDRAIAAAADCSDTLRARAFRAAALLHGLIGDVTSALPLLEQSAALASDPIYDCDCNPMLRMFRNPRESIPLLEERIAFCRRTGDSKGLGHLFETSGQAHYFLGELGQARLHFEECVRLGRDEADRETLLSGLFGLARVSILGGDLAAAETNVSAARALAEANGDLDNTGAALGYLGDLARARGDWDSARQFLDTAERMARAANDSVAVVRARYFLARLAEWEGESEPPEVSAAFEDALALGRTAGAPRYHEVRCLLGMGSAKQAMGDLNAATGFILEAIETAQALGDLQGTAMAYDCLSRLAAEHGNADEASMLAHRALELHDRIGERPAVVESLSLVAALAVDAGRHAFAVRLLACTQNSRDVHGYALPRRAQLSFDSDVSRLRSALSKKAFAAAWEEGAALPLDEAVLYALRGRGSRDRPGSGWESLTPAEWDVVRLVGEGLTNPEVGRRLFISPRTVGHHLSHVYDKLGVRTRHALVKELAEHGR